MTTWATCSRRTFGPLSPPPPVTNDTTTDWFWVLLPFLVVLVHGNVVVVVTAKKRTAFYRCLTFIFVFFMVRYSPGEPFSPHRASFWFCIIKQIITSNNNNIAIMTMIMVVMRMTIMMMTTSTTVVVYGHPKSCVHFPIRLITCSLTRAITSILIARDHSYIGT